MIKLDMNVSIWCYYSAIFYCVHVTYNKFNHKVCFWSQYCSFMVTYLQHVLVRDCETRATILLLHDLLRCSLTIRNMVYVIFNDLFLRVITYFYFNRVFIEHKSLPCSMTLFIVCARHEIVFHVLSVFERAIFCWISF